LPALGAVSGSVLEERMARLEREIADILTQRSTVGSLEGDLVSAREKMEGY